MFDETVDESYTSDAHTAPPEPPRSQLSFTVRKCDTNSERDLLRQAFRSGFTTGLIAMQEYNLPLAMALLFNISGKYKVVLECSTMVDERGNDAEQRWGFDPALGGSFILISVGKRLLEGNEEKKIERTLFHEILHALGTNKKKYHNISSAQGLRPLDQTFACEALAFGTPTTCKVELCRGKLNPTECPYEGICVTRNEKGPTGFDVAPRQSGGSNAYCEYCGTAAQIVYTPPGYIFGSNPPGHRPCCTTSTRKNGSFAGSIWPTSWFCSIGGPLDVDLQPLEPW